MKTSPFGTWKSPISANLIVSSSTQLVELSVRGSNLFFLESRPSERGRYTLMKKQPDSGDVVEVLGENDYARTTVHEYGGRHFTLCKNGNVVWSEFHTQNLNLFDGTQSIPIYSTKDQGERRFACGVEDPHNASLIFVCEDHSVIKQEGKKEPRNSIVEFVYDSSSQKWNMNEIAGGDHDFYSSPAVSQDGEKIAFVAWNHPNMPWDNTILYEYNRKTKSIQLIAGQAHASNEDGESIMLPKYGPDNLLYFISDRKDTSNPTCNGIWRIFRCDQNGKIELFFQDDKEKSEVGGPAWVFGAQPYDFLGKDEMVVAYGPGKLARVRLDQPRHSQPIKNDRYQSVSHLHTTQDGRCFFFIGSHPQRPTAVVLYSLEEDTFTEVKKSQTLDIDAGYLSTPQSISFPTSQNDTAYANYYPPRNKDYEAPEGQLPPVVTIIHGGPSSCARKGLNMFIQFYTSRGIAVCDVNYRGSTGFGRSYRHSLYNNWGVSDVDDCSYCIKYLSSQGMCDAEKAVIRGGSAGGFTVLACLTFQPDVFNAGCSLYGVADLNLLATDTHKFESRYLDNLIGDYNKPEENRLYSERSPIHYINRIKAPLYLLHGTEDKIVPPNQSQVMFDSLKKKGIPVALTLFEKEQHGFRIAENQRVALEKELYFYSRILKFQPADELQPLHIENL